MCRCFSVVVVVSLDFVAVSLLLDFVVAGCALLQSAEISVVSGLSQQYSQFKQQKQQPDNKMKTPTRGCFSLSAEAILLFLHPLDILLLTYITIILLAYKYLATEVYILSIKLTHAYTIMIVDSSSIIVIVAS